MGKKKTTSSAKAKRSSKSEKSPSSQKTTLRQQDDDVKFNLTFLVNTTFKGVIYEKGTTISIEPHEAEAYKGRSAYKIERA